MSVRVNDIAEPASLVNLMRHDSTYRPWTIVHGHTNDQNLLDRPDGANPVTR